MASAVPHLLLLEWGKIGDEWRVHFTDRKGRHVAVPNGTVIRFPYGFMVRQIDDASGMKFYGHPSKQFWTVTVKRQKGVWSIKVPGAYDYRGRSGKSRFYRKTHFIPLRDVDTPRRIVVKKLPKRKTRFTV